jgi:hypothetical protein
MRETLCGVRTAGLAAFTAEVEEETASEVDGSSALVLRGVLLGRLLF